MNKLYIFTSALLLLNGSTAHSIDIFHEISQGNLSRNTQSWLKSPESKTMVNDYGQTILHQAVLTGNMRVIKQIAISNVDINALDKDGKTALDYAVDYGYKSAIHYLLKKNASVTTQENAFFIKKLLQPISIINKVIKTIFIIGAVAFTFGITLLLLSIPLASLGGLLAFIQVGLPGLGIIAISAPFLSLTNYANIPMNKYYTMKITA
ncbi:MAG: ankyrin repeat domain-containing protein [Candidatus Babeliales bacterium]